MNFKSLKDQWYKILKDHGFKDIEDKHGNVKDYNRRTQRFDDREQVLTFFRKLDQMLANEWVPSKDRSILSLYTQGLPLKDIVQRSGYGLTTVKSCIKKYKSIL